MPVKKHIRNLLVVWLLTGLWHGAAWNFVAWGLYYGIILIIEKYFLQKKLERLPAVFGHIYSLVLVMIGWVLFFSPSLGGAWEYLKLMFGAGGHGFMDGEALYLLISNLGLWVIAIVSSTPLVYGVYERYVGRRKPVADVVIYAGMFLLCVAYLVTETYNPFLYFRF